MAGRLDREIWALAVPALGALVAEPVLVLVDSAMVGHLGTNQLAGLSLASTVLMTVVGVFVFLAYATTSLTARRIGAGDREGAVRAGVDGAWLAVLIGVLTAAVVVGLTPWLVRWLGAGEAVAPYAEDYLYASAPGIPGMLLVLAGSGALRGQLDTRTPLRVAVTGALANIGLNAVLIYGLRLGVAGSGLGTAIAQTGMGLALGRHVLRSARQAAVSVRPRGAGIWRATLDGLPLLLRTLTLRGAILATVTVAALLGPVTLAAHQVVTSMWSLAAFVLDALAIAAQALVGQATGAGDQARIRLVVGRTERWGLLGGVGLGVVFAGLGPLLPYAFSADPAVRHAAWVGLTVAGAVLPLAGFVYVLDGVLIGAGDGPYLALAGLVVLTAYVPALWLVAVTAAPGAAGLGWLWAAYGVVLMGARGLSLGLRARGSRWLTAA
ncbi:MAG: MATE family efflux transporter [Actinomycetia bacterium]|nr:MATE family efflux transporter [Actinomycetes bacterium]